MDSADETTTHLRRIGRERGEAIGRQIVTAVHDGVIGQQNAPKNVSAMGDAVRALEAELTTNGFSLAEAQIAGDACVQAVREVFAGARAGVAGPSGGRH